MKPKPASFFDKFFAKIRAFFYVLKCCWNGNFTLMFQNSKKNKTYYVEKNDADVNFGTVLQSRMKVVKYCVNPVVAETEKAANQLTMKM